MKKRAAFPYFLLFLLVGGIAVAAAGWQNDQDARGFKLYGLGAPDRATSATRAQDVAPGACIPKSPGANTLPFICSVADTDYVTPAYGIGGDVSGTLASVNVIKLRETSGPTHLTIGAIADGALTKRSGSTFIGATADTDFVTPSFTLGGDLSGTPTSANVLKLRETAGPTHLTIGSVPDGSFLQRSGSTLVGTAAVTSVSLTATDIGYGSGANLLTGSSNLKFSNAANAVVTVGDGSTSTNAQIFLDNTGTFSNRLQFRQGGVVHSNWFAQRDGTATTGLVQAGITITPVSGGSNNDTFRIQSATTPSSGILFYPATGDVAIGGPNGGDEMSSSSSTGFLFIPRMDAAPGTPPARVGVSGGVRSRDAIVLDRGNKRFYWYDSVGAAWRFASFDNGNGANAITALTGDVAATGPGSVAATIAAQAVTLSKIVNFVTDSFPCRDTAGTGSLEVCAVGGGIEFTGGPGIQTSAFTGDVTKTPGGTALTIANNAVSDGKLRDSGALSVIGRSVNTTGDPGDISASAGSDAVLRESGSTLGFGTIATGGIANNAVTDGKLRQSAGLSVVGRSGGTTGNVADITATTNGDVLRMASGALGWGAIPESSVTNLTTDLAGKLADPGNNGALYRTSSGVTSALNGTTGSVMYFGSTGVPAQDNANLFWDATNHRLGVGTTSPSGPLEVRGSGTNDTLRVISSSATSGGAYIQDTAANGQAVLLVDNNRGSQAAYGGFLTGGSTSPASTIFGLSPADRTFLFADGASSLGLGVGTVTNVPLTIGTNNTARITVAGGGSVTVSSLGSGIVQSTSGVLSNASAADIAAAQVWPTADDILFSSGASTAPNGDAGFAYDTGSDIVSISGGDSLALYNLGSRTANTNYERLACYRSSNVYNIESQQKGTGVVRDIKVNAGTANLRLAGAEVRASTLTAGGLVGTDPAIGFGALVNVSPSAEFNYFFELTTGTVTTLNGADQYIATSNNTTFYGSTVLEYPVAKTVPAFYRLEACLVGSNTISTGEVSLCPTVGGSGGVALTFDSGSSGCLRTSGTNFGGGPTDAVGLRMCQSSGIGGRNTATLSGTLRLAIKVRWQEFSTF